MNRKIIYLVNPISGTREKTTLTKIITAETTARKIPFELLPSVASGDYNFVKQKIKEEGVTDVVICGGDGTVNQVVQSLHKYNIRFGIIPMGSGNGLAYCAGISKNVKKALEVIFKGRAKPVDAFKLNDHFACMLSGLGFDAQVAHAFANESKRGLLTYTKQSLKIFFSVKAKPFTVEVNGEKFSTEAFFISIANSNQFGNHVTIAPKASLNDGLLDVVIVPKMSKALLPVAMLQQLRTNKIVKKNFKEAKGIVYLQAPALKITNHGKAPFHIDGEPMESEKVFDIKVIPSCFDLLQ